MDMLISRAMSFRLAWGILTIVLLMTVPAAAQKKAKSSPKAVKWEHQRSRYPFLAPT